MIDPHVLPIIFVALMGLAILVYAILDGYDLGVGVLLPVSETREADRDIMIASIGPFWDANETWLVLAVGLMLIAFPTAHSLFFYHLYLPAAFMLIGLILRGVAFDFRAKAAVDHKLAWDRTFKAGSLITCLTQGYMLGQYVMGFENSLGATIFSLLSAFCVTAAFSYIGATWLIMKTEGDLQKTAVSTAKVAGRIAALGVVSVSMVNPWVNNDVYQRWFDVNPGTTLLIPVICFTAFVVNDRLLNRLPLQKDKYNWLPLLIVISIFLCCFTALAFSFYPAIIPGELTIWEAASAPESLQFILFGAVIVVPVILSYTVYSYWVFHGKATELRYH